MPARHLLRSTRWAEAGTRWRLLLLRLPLGFLGSWHGASAVNVDLGTFLQTPMGSPTQPHCPSSDPRLNLSGQTGFWIWGGTISPVADRPTLTTTSYVMEPQQHLGSVSCLLHTPSDNGHAKRPWWDPMCATLSPKQLGFAGPV